MLEKNEIKNLVENHNNAMYIESDAYYEGKNVKIETAPKKRNPDNRVPIAFVNRLVKNLSGYAARPDDILIVQEQIEQSKVTSYEDGMFQINSENREGLVNSEIYKNVLKYGIAFDLVWTEGKDNFKIKYAPIPTAQCIPIFNQELSVTPSLKELIRVFKNGEKKMVTHYHENGYTEYELKTDTGKSELQFIKEQPQPFGMCQASVYIGNYEKLAYWRPVKSLIDEIDKVLSKSANEVDRFNDTWIAFMQKIDAETKDKIDELGVIDNLQTALKDGISDVFPRFIERNVPVEHNRMMLDKLEQFIYTIIGVPNFLDESLGNASGVSMLYRLIGLEYAANEIDTYFDGGLINRNDLIKKAYSVIGSYAGYKYENADNYNPHVTHKRNIPIDKTAIINEALILKGLGISTETVLKYLPKGIVPDVQAELDKMESAPLGIEAIEV